MHPFAIETAAILVHSLNKFSLCTNMAAVAVAKLLLCCDICKCYIVGVFVLQFLESKSGKNTTFEDCPIEVVVDGDESHLSALEASGHSMSPPCHMMSTPLHHAFQCGGNQVVA